MILKKEIRSAILSLWLLSAGGWLLHFRIHPISQNSSFYIPFIFGLFHILVTPWLLNFKKTVLAGYLATGLGVIIGTVTMAHFGLSHLPESVTFMHILFKTTLADILILLPKLIIAHGIFRHFYPAGLGRMFTPSWWAKHFAYISVIYGFGVFIWR